MFESFLGLSVILWDFMTRSLLIWASLRIRCGNLCVAIMNSITSSLYSMIHAFHCLEFSLETCSIYALKTIVKTVNHLYSSICFVSYVELSFHHWIKRYSKINLNSQQKTCKICGSVQCSSCLRFKLKKVKPVCLDCYYDKKR